MPCRSSRHSRRDSRSSPPSHRTRATGSDLMPSYFNNFSNPQQIGSYQQTQPGSMPQVHRSTPLVSTQQPSGTPQPQPSESFFDRQMRVYGGPAGQQTQNPGTQSQLRAPAAASSPVSSNGRLSSAPAVQMAPPLQAAPQPAPSGQSIRIDHRTYAGPDDLNKISPGAAVSDKPGY